MRPTKIFLLLIFFCSNLIGISAQEIVFKTAKSNPGFHAALEDDFHQVTVFELENNLLSEKTSRADFDYTLNLKLGDKYEWDLELYPADMFDENALIRVLTENGEIIHPVPRNISFKGQIKGNPRQQVSMLIHGNYIYGHITEGENRTYIVSANRFVKTASENLYLVYERGDQKSRTVGTCGLDAYPQFDLKETQKHDHNHHEKTRSVTGLCYDVELGIVSDYSLYTDKGSTIQGAIDHVVGVMMDVETDYEIADIDDALEFEIVEQVISICDFCDEWTDSNGADDLLDDLTSWTDGGGFNNSVDMSQLWTNRDYTGPTVGLAWIGAGLLCNQAYHVLQDFSTNADELRVMTAHEIGHNLNAVHDVGSGNIMAPNVGTATTWSSTSVSTIDGSVDAAATASCISACAATPCSPVTNVSITNVTTTGFDISWTATTESAYRVRVRDEDDYSFIYTDAPTSSTTTTINPIGWEACNKYSIIVENDCGSSVYSAPVSSLTAYSVLGCADFSVDEFLAWGSLTVNFTDASFGATSWDWDFGDTQSSTAQNPSHTYSAPGAYTVSLTVNSGGHTMTKTDLIYVLPTSHSLPYTTSDGGDMSDDDFGTISLTSGKTSLFEKGIPSNYFSNSTSCWVTDLDGDMENTENEMALYSPDFDFSGSTAATLSFRLGMEAAFGNAPYGVQVQYSTNGGTSWTRLGADTDASWYTQGPSSGSALAATIFTDQMGWLYNSAAGVNFSYNIDALAGTSSVIFRFVFSLDAGWTGGYDRAGAMIDNFAISATLLPVDLTAFDGELRGESVVLNWETSSETDNDFFMIEKSNDGRNFEKLEVIEGSGNSTVTNNYELIDKQPFIGVNYYRLTQVDYDGTYEVFDKVVTVYFHSDSQMALQPNPTKGNPIQLIYKTEREGALEIQVFNASGHLAKQLNVNALKARNVFEIPMNDLSNGVYFLRAVHRYDIQSLRFVKTD